MLAMLCYICGYGIVRLLVCAGLSLFIIGGPYLYVVVCVLYAYNLTEWLNANHGGCSHWGASMVTAMAMASSWKGLGTHFAAAMATAKANLHIY